ncbi:MAG: SdrD B-like domain-containing protein [Caldilineaceae bacterium]
MRSTWLCPAPRPALSPANSSSTLTTTANATAATHPGPTPVTLWTKVGAAASTMTDASGVYSFSADPGRYEIGVTGQGGYLFSPQDVGDDATDSDVGPTGRSATVVLDNTNDCARRRPGHPADADADEYTDTNCHADRDPDAAG